MTDPATAAEAREALARQIVSMLVKNDYISAGASLSFKCIKDVDAVLATDPALDAYRAAVLSLDGTEFEGATSGPWVWAAGAGSMPGDSWTEWNELSGYRDVIISADGGWWPTGATARLIAAAPTLAAKVREQDATIAELREALAWFVAPPSPLPTEVGYTPRIIDKLLVFVGLSSREGGVVPERWLDNARLKRDRARALLAKE